MPLFSSTDAGIDNDTDVLHVSRTHTSRTHTSMSRSRQTTIGGPYARTAHRIATFLHNSLLPTISTSGPPSDDSDPNANDGLPLISIAFVLVRSNAAPTPPSAATYISFPGSLLKPRPSSTSPLCPVNAI